MNPMSHPFNDIPSSEGMGMISGFKEVHATGAKRSEWFGQMTVSHLISHPDFPAMSTPVTWRNVKPHWR